MEHYANIFKCKKLSQKLSQVKCNTVLTANFDNFLHLKWEQKIQFQRSFIL